MRSKNKIIILWAAFLFLAVRQTKADPIEYVLSHHCGSHLSLWDSVLLKEDRSWGAMPMLGQPCNITLKADPNPYNYGNYLRIQVLGFQADCQDNQVQLYDGPGENGPAKSMANLCGNLPHENKMFASLTDTVSIVWTSQQYNPNFRVKILATAFTDSIGGDGYFPCHNGFEVVSSLMCDGYNNCGDWSDERTEHCRWWHKKRHLLIGCGVGGLVLIIVTTVVIIVVRRRRRQRKERKLALPKDRQTVSPPSYGSVQGEDNPVFTLPHPPSSSSK